MANIGPSFISITGVLACILCIVILSPAAVAEVAKNMVEQPCHIRGKVIDSYGTCVPGAEVRLMTSDGQWCEIPDNPVLSGMNVPGKSGSFEFRNLSQQRYVLHALKDSYNGSITLYPGEGVNYVEITLPGYTYVHPAQCVTASQVSATEAALVSAGSSAAASVSTLAEPENTIPDLSRLVLGSIVIVAGVLLATALLKRR